MMKLTVLILCFNLVSYSLLDICRVLLPELQGTYQGRCRNGLAHGRGSAEGVDSYEGVFRKGLPHGEGKYSWPNGDYYEGSFQKGLKHGRGIFYIAEKDSSFFGIWRRGEFVRLGYQHEPREIKYQVVVRRNVDRTRFYKMGEGNRVHFKFFESTGGNRPISNLLIDGSTGTYYNITRELGYENIVFPFEGKVRFTALNKFRSGWIDYEIQFIINEPGFWEVTISY